jgi:hypothetical protein
MTLRRYIRLNDSNPESIPTSSHIAPRSSDVTLNVDEVGVMTVFVSQRRVPQAATELAIFPSTSPRAPP